MDTLEIPGYRALVPNCVYSRHRVVSDDENPFVGHPPVSELVVLNRRISPRTEDVLDAIVATAEKIPSFELGEVHSQSERRLLGGFDGLLRSVGEAIAKRDEEILQKLRRHRKGVLVEGNRYLSCILGLIPHDQIDIFENSIHNDRRDLFYHNCADSTGWELVLKLREDWRLLDFEEMRRAFDIRAYHCDQLKVFNRMPNYSDIIGRVRFVYGLFSNKDLSVVYDDSDDMFYGVAGMMLGRLKADISNEIRDQSLARVFRGNDQKLFGLSELKKEAGM